MRKLRQHACAPPADALITDPALAATNGKYFEGMREIRSSGDSHDDGRPVELWQASAALTGIA